MVFTLGFFFMWQNVFLIFFLLKLFYTHQRSYNNENWVLRSLRIFWIWLRKNGSCEGFSGIDIQYLVIIFRSYELFWQPKKICHNWLECFYAQNNLIKKLFYPQNSGIFLHEIGRLSRASGKLPYRGNTCGHNHSVYRQQRRELRWRIHVSYNLQLS